MGTTWDAFLLINHRDIAQLRGEFAEGGHPHQSNASYAEFLPRYICEGLASTWGLKCFPGATVHDNCC